MIPLSGKYPVQNTAKGKISSRYTGRIFQNPGYKWIFLPRWTHGLPDRVHQHTLMKNEAQYGPGFLREFLGRDPGSFIPDFGSSIVFKGGYFSTRHTRSPGLRSSQYISMSDTILLFRPSSRFIPVSSAFLSMKFIPHSGILMFNSSIFLSTLGSNLEISGPLALRSFQTHISARDRWFLYQ